MTTQALWQEFGGELDAFLRRHVRNAADAEDLRQQVFLNIHRRLADGQPPSHARGWVYQIARNAIVDHRRRQGARPDAAIDAGAAVARAAVAVEEADGRLVDDVARCLLSMLERLPEPYRSAVRWADVEGVPQAVGAERAGVSVSGMKARVQRGRAKLRETFAECCRVEFDRRRNPIRHECTNPCP